MEHVTTKRSAGIWRASGRLMLIAPLLFAASRAAAMEEPSTQPSGSEEQLVSKGLDPSGTGVTLTVGRSRLLVTKAPLRTVDVTQPDFVIAKVVTPTNLVITGKKSGITQIVLWDDQGHSQEVDVIIEPDIQALQGQLKTLAPGSKIEATVVNGSVVLRGRAPSTETADQMVQIAQTYSTKVINLLEIGGGQQVMLQVRFAEVSRSAISSLGINFSAVVAGKGFGVNQIGGVGQWGLSGGPPPSLSVSSPSSAVTLFGQAEVGQVLVDAFIAALRENDLLRVLAEPNLTTTSGHEASFLAGGEFPIPVPQSAGAGGGGTAITIEYKQFGVRLTFLPVVLGDGRIRLRAMPEVSDLDQTHSVSFGGFTIPGLTTRRADATVELTEGQSLALAGLLNNRVTANSQVTPLLGDLPIIGTLFRSVRWERDETELLVLVTPRLVGGMNPAKVPEIPGQHWRYPTEGELFWHRDLGGPAPASGPTNRPQQFHGTYGFAPVQEPVAAGSMK